MRKNIVSDDVRDFILDYIKDQKITVGQRLPSLRAIAAESGASMPTVQRAVAMLVSEGNLYSKIGSGTFVAERNNVESSLIGILTPHVDSHVGNFISDSIISIKKTLQKAGYCPVILEPPSGLWGEQRDKEEIKLIKRFLKLDVRGIIADASAAVNSPVWRYLKQLPVPVVCFNNCDNTNELNYVTLDNHKAGQMVAQHFLDHGHRCLAVVTGSFCDSLSVVERIRGFEDTLAENGLKAKIISNRSSDQAETRRVINSLPVKADKITGFFGINDPIAIQLMTAYRDAGYKIPQQVSFIGFDDSLFCDHVHPRLTSVNQLSAYMGKRAVEVLLEQLENKHEYRETIQIRLTPQLTIRDSVSAVH
jgi:DNA-binding LacI/PurR family transcriptional regulator